MKYSDKNPPIVCMQKNSTCYKKTTKMKIEGVLWHSTGANNPNIKRYVQPLETDSNYKEMIDIIGYNKNHNDWNHIYKEAGLNCWIGKLANGSVATVQTMPWDYRPWGCGSGKYGSCNSGWIQFEICEDGLNDPVYFQQIYQEACEITAYLCKKFNIDPHGYYTTKNGTKIPRIIDHVGSYKLGYGSGHSDVGHWFPKFGKSMATARDDVAKLIAAASSSAPQTSGPANLQKEDEEEVTKEQFAQMMDEYIEDLANKPATWESPSLEWAQQNNLMSGDEKGRLMPKKYMTRGEMATMFMRFAKTILPGLK